MTEEQQKKIKNRLTVLTFGIILLLAILLIVLATTKKMSTIWFPIGTGTLLALYWVVADVLPVIWLRQFEDRTESQKRSYCIYALIDAVGLAGLLYFIMSLTSMTGALVYVASVFMKKRFHDEYLGVSPADAEPEGEAEPEDGSSADAKPEREASLGDGSPVNVKPEGEAEPEDGSSADAEPEGKASFEDGPPADAEAEELPGETVGTDAKEQEDSM